MGRESEMVVIETDGTGKPTIWCDPEIVDLVTALNAAGIKTIASCSGHGRTIGNIALADGRELFIANDFEEARHIARMFPGANGEFPAYVDISKTLADIEECLDLNDQTDRLISVLIAGLRLYRIKALDA